MKRMVFLLVISLLAISSCVEMSEEIPEDFSLVLDWNTGALPPEYHYEYSVTIGPGTQGEFIYHPGYEENPDTTWITSFNISETDLQSLFDFLKENNILRKNWQSGQPLLGGKNTSINITAFDQQYLVPSISEVSQGDRELVERTIEEIRSYVPEDIWTEMNARQAEYEQNYQ